jgi:dipeptidyl aminopeptidase/acylaminoacyl peptidase
MTEARLRELLRDVPIPAAADAEERGLRVVREAFAQREVTTPAPRVRLRLILALAGALVLLALLLSPAGAKVRDWIGDAVTTGEQPAAPALTSIPGGGQLLVESPQGAWIVHPDGSRRLLGTYRDATWSPHGLYVAVASAHQLSAVDPVGTVRWSLSRPQPISSPRWSPSGFRVAYLAGDSLRVVAGDGTEDRLLVPRVATVAPAWRPGGAHVLAYGDPKGGVHVVNADTGRKLLPPVPHGPDLLELSWSRDGQRLLALYPHVALVIDPPRRLMQPLIHLAGPRDGRFVAAAFAPAGHRLAAIVEHRRNAEPRSELVVANVDGTVTGRPAPRQVFSGPGSFPDLAWSPNARRLLLSWREPDQWLFVPTNGRGRVKAVGNIARQFDPGATSSPAFPRVAGWCCPP